MSAENNLGTAPVDLALVLAIDCSSSVDAGDYVLQMQGTANALRHPAILEAINAGPFKKIAATLVHWSSRNSQVVAVPWHGLSNIYDIEAFASKVETADRQWQPGGTGLAKAIDFCVGLFDTLPVACARNVIDVSGDGADNENGNLAKARQNAVANTVTVNGLPIVYGQKHIADYYAVNVMCGPNAFIVPTENLNSFPQAMRIKLLRELQTQTS
jgi:Ca-activated chloride channel homolog